MPEPDLLDRVIDEIRVRKAALAPVVKESEVLVRTLAALNEPPAATP
jgi:hypothetical protein